jgi:hypothetical protein
MSDHIVHGTVHGKDYSPQINVITHPSVPDVYLGLTWNHGDVEGSVTLDRTGTIKLRDLLNAALAATSESEPDKIQSEET